MITQDEIILLRELSDRTGYARVKSKHLIDFLFKITAKKKQPDIITLLFRNDDTSTEIKYRFLIPNSRQFVEKLTARLQPAKTKNNNDSNS